jgi:hypothetical protein
MASTLIQRKCEQWIIDKWLPEKYGMTFTKQRLRMHGGGLFEFDAVSSDLKIIANVSTATACTHRGSVASGKKSKLRADCLMLQLGSGEKKLMILTEPCLYELAIKEQKVGRLPLDIEICHAVLPQRLRIELEKAREKASQEVRSSGKEGA